MLTCLRFIQIFESLSDIPKRHGLSHCTLGQPGATGEWIELSQLRSQASASPGAQGDDPSSLPSQRPSLSPQLSLPVPPLTSPGRVSQHWHPGKDTKHGESGSRPSLLPEVIPRGDRVSGKPAVQAAKVIARVAFRRSFVKITVPFDLDPYHTALNRKEESCLGDGQLDKTGDALRPGVDLAGAPWKGGGRPRRGWGKCCRQPPAPAASGLLLQRRRELPLSTDYTMGRHLTHSQDVPVGLLLVQFQLLPQRLRAKQQVLSVPSLSA